MKQAWTLALAGAFACVSPACSSSDDVRTAAPVDLLDPQAPHYGKTYAEWAAAWIAYINSVAPPECANPIKATSGTGCALYQDPASPVFFLAGNVMGLSIRTGCVVPKDKALFFPLLEVSGDNAGVPADQLLSDAELESYVIANFGFYQTSTLHASVDGQSIGHLERGGIMSAPYSLEFPAGDNAYTCLGTDGVVGTFNGFLSGYWVLLAPLASGPHAIEFGGETMGSTPSQNVTIDVRYPDLTFQ
jgi:hypothetical protein